MQQPADAIAIIKSRQYVGLLIGAVIIGIPVSAFAYAFLFLISILQKWIFQALPAQMGAFATWWPVLPLAVAGLLVGLIVRKFPGGGGELPIKGFKAGAGPTPKANILGIIFAAIISIGFGAVIGPESPLVALGSGLAVWMLSLRRQLPEQALSVIGASGSFSAISTLLGSPLAGGFLLMEAAELAGITREIVLLPGLLAAGIGYLIFVGLDALTGLGTFSLAVTNLPKYGSPTLVQLIWAIIFGLLAPFGVKLIRATGNRLYERVLTKNLVLNTTLAGVVVGLLAGLFTLFTHASSSYVLFSGQNELGPLIHHAAGFSILALILMLLFKGLGYAISLVSFRGGPTFPAMFLGAAFGLVISHLTGLDLMAGVATGITAMVSSVLRLPITAVLLTTIFLGTDGVRLIPLSIFASVVAYVASVRLQAN